MASNSVTLVESFRQAAARQEVAAWNYKGLEVHADPRDHEQVAKIVAATVPVGSKVLDIAAGSGALCLRLKDLGMIPTGVDLVDENFRLHGEVDFIKTNLNDDLPAQLRGSFDCVTATELIEHLENPRHFIRQCFEILRPGGLLVLSTPNTASSISLAQFVRTGEFRWFMAEHYDCTGHITPILLPVLCNALKEAGFTDIHLTSVAPLEFTGLSWWKMRLLAWFLRKIASRPLYEGDFLIASAQRPRQLRKV